MIADLLAHGMTIGQVAPQYHYMMARRALEDKDGRPGAGPFIIGRAYGYGEWARCTARAEDVATFEVNNGEQVTVQRVPLFHWRDGSESVVLAYSSGERALDSTPIRRRILAVRRLMGGPGHASVLGQTY